MRESRRDHRTEYVPRLHHLSATFVLTALALTGLSIGAAIREPVEDAVTTFTWSPNMTPLGFSSRTVNEESNPRWNSDLAFWGQYAYHAHYDGFRIIDISDPANPIELTNYTDCVGNQGAVSIWENLLVRSWTSRGLPTASCGGEVVGTGFEGISIFDVSNPSAPILLRNLRMAADTAPTGCGSHTNLLVPDVARGNLYIYSMASDDACPGVDIVRIPLADPASAVFLRHEPGGRSCLGGGAILGDVNLLACAGGDGATVWHFDPSLDPPAAGSFEDPIQLWSQAIPGVSVAGAAVFTWDGEVLAVGHFPGGGAAAACQAESPETDKSVFFFNARTGNALGSFVLPRPQTITENCGWYNFNTVPTASGYALVAGNFQAGISVVDFTNPAAAREIAYADPAPLSSASVIPGGDWASYWYNGHIYESDMTRGLIIWSLSDSLTDGARMLARLPSPRLQEFSIALEQTPSDRLDRLEEAIATVPDSAFSAPGHRTAIGSRLNEAEAAIAAGDVERARQLLTDLRRHLDGCETGAVGDRNDWVTDCTEQNALRALLDALIASL